MISQMLSFRPSVWTGHSRMESRFSVLLVLGLLLGGGILFPGGKLDAQEQRNLRHILIATENVANKLLAAAQSGTDFKMLARRYSLDVGTKILGGDLDWVSPGQMEPEFSLAAFSIPEIGGFTTCKTRYGWHVIQYVDQRGVVKKEPSDKGADSGGANPETADKGKSEVNSPNNPLPVNPSADRNEDITWQISFSDRTYTPGKNGETPQIDLTIRATNKSETALKVIDPVLWPLGLIVRYQFGKLNVPVNAPEGYSRSKFKLEEIAPGATIQRSFKLQDYVDVSQNWPIVRVIWRGDTLFDRSSKQEILPTGQDSLQKMKSRWRFYRSGEANFNLLPEVKSDERWVVCIFSSGRIWIELNNNEAIPGLNAAIVSSIRKGDWDKRPFDFFNNQVLRFGLSAQSTGNQGIEIPSSAQFTGVVNRGDFIALPTKLSNSALGFGQRFGLSITDGAQLSTKNGSIIGRIILEEGDPLRRLEERNGEKKTSQITLALAWPYDLIPDRTRKAMEKSSEEKVDLQKKEVSTPKVKTVEAKKPILQQSPKEILKKEEERAKVREKAKQSTLEKVIETKPAQVLVPLPRIQMETSNGTFLIQLFENDAPNTVAHFIHLVESGFYDGLTFHRRVRTDSSEGFVQGGSPDGTSAGKLDYTIVDEPSIKRPAKKYSVVMARHHTRDNSASTQFFIALDDLDYLNGQYTVFGEIINGQQSAMRLDSRSTIKSMKVLSKRDREYKFKKFNQSQ